MDGEGRAVLASRQALEMLGIDSLEPDAFAGWRDTEAHHLDGRPVQPHEWPMARTLADGETVAAEKYEVVVSGRPVILEIASAPVISPTDSTAAPWRSSATSRRGNGRSGQSATS